MRVVIVTAHSAVDTAVELGRLSDDESPLFEQDGEGTSGRIYLPHVLKAEKKLAQLIRTLIATPPAGEEWSVPAGAARGLSDEQASVLDLLADGPTEGNGFTEVTDPDELAALGLTPEMLRDDANGFAAHVMRHEDGTIVVQFEGTTVIERKDFDLNWNAALETGGVLVGKDVTIELELQGTVAA